MLVSMPCGLAPEEEMTTATTATITAAMTTPADQAQTPPPGGPRRVGLLGREARVTGAVPLFST